MRSCATLEGVFCSLDFFSFFFCGEKLLIRLGMATVEITGAMWCLVSNLQETGRVF